MLRDYTNVVEAPPRPEPPHPPRRGPRPEITVRRSDWDRLIAIARHHGELEP